MAGSNDRLQHGGSDAARLLRERLRREQVGDAAYEKEVSFADDRAFRTFGILFVVGFAFVVFGTIWLVH